MSDRAALPRAQEGARKILRDCLRVTPGDRVSIIYDETTTDTAGVLISEGRILGLDISEHYVGLEHQRKFSPDRGLCRRCRGALRGYVGILTCVSAESETTAYRRELLREAASGRTRVGHMPGAGPFVLEWAVNVDYETARARCEDLALALALGTKATLETSAFDEHGVETARCSLQLDLGGLVRLPITSTGIVPSGAWGNLPGGETFIAPIEGSTSGAIVINGAFKNRVLGPAEALVIRFDQGRIADVSGTSDCIDAFHKLTERAVNNCDPHWNQLAELGIGVNQGITALTGNSLFDEKCAGTIHIAIGENQDFGGTLESQIHEDLVTRKPSLWVDGRPILLQGQDVFAPGDWYEDLDSYPVNPMLADGDPHVGRRPESTSIGNGCLRRVHQVAAGKTCVYRVGNEATSACLLQIFSHIRPLGRIPVSRLCAELNEALQLTDHQIKAGLSILNRHGLVFVAGHEAP
jgi:aminopeptidase